MSDDMDTTDHISTVPEGEEEGVEEWYSERMVELTALQADERDRWAELEKAREEARLRRTNAITEAQRVYDEGLAAITQELNSALADADARVKEETAEAQKAWQAAKDRRDQWYRDYRASAASRLADLATGT